MNEWIVWWMNELLWDVWVDICNCVCNVLYYILICVFVFQGQIKPLDEIKPHEIIRKCLSSTRTRNMYVYTCIHVDIYTYTHRYTYIHCIHKRIYIHKATCESVISTKFANATTLPPKPRAYLMSVKASTIKQNIRRYSRILNHNKQMRIASCVLQHHGFKQNYVKYR